MPMKKRYVIVIERETRDKMKSLAKKSDTYDSFINELISLKEHKVDE